MQCDDDLIFGCCLRFFLFNKVVRIHDLINIEDILQIFSKLRFVKEKKDPPVIIKS